MAKSARGEEAEKEEARSGRTQLCERIGRILNECQHSLAVHGRKLKEMGCLRSTSHPDLDFTHCWTSTLSPLFATVKRAPSTERLVRFVALFAVSEAARPGDAFLEDFLRFLLASSAASNKAVRFRSCQIVSEIMMQLPDDAEVSDELWDELVECMKGRIQDKIPIVRAFAVRALARFAIDAENGDVVELFRKSLSSESNVEVRKMLVLSMPPSNFTSLDIIERTLDPNESVRKAAYYVLANKFPIQTLSIKQRTVILQRGLVDRSPAVKKECTKLMKDAWLMKCCNGDPISLLKFLDVETYELVGEAVIDELLRSGMAHVQEDQSIRNFLVPAFEENKGQKGSSIQVMEPEVALYWRKLCRHLQMEAQTRGRDAAATTGTEAVVYAAEASDRNELLERILPATVSDFVKLIKSHEWHIGFQPGNCCYLGRVAAEFVQELLHAPLEHEIDEEDGNKVVLGDGINLGGDRDWAKAVAELAKYVHASPGEFEEVVTSVIEELARPCRQRDADFLQWMHCLAVTGLLLENARSLLSLQGKAINPSELLQTLLLPAAKHIHVDVQRAAVRNLGLFGLLERRPREDVLKQLRLSFVSGPSSVSIVAAKALFDLAMWHGPEEVDKAVGLNSFEQIGTEKQNNESSSDDGSPKSGILELLYSGLERNDWDECTEIDGLETVGGVLAEGFAKMLLQSKGYPSLSSSMHPLILEKLITFYFSEETKLPRWPGMFGNPGGVPKVVSNLRRRATQVSLFMLQMMQTSLYKFPGENGEKSSNDKSGGNRSGMDLDHLDIDSREEGLAIRLAVEVLKCHVKRTAAGKSYILALCRVVVSLRFCPSQQDALKLMRMLLNQMVGYITSDNQVLKDLKSMATHLKTQDEDPNRLLSSDQIKFLLGKLELDDFDVEALAKSDVTTPAARTRTVTKKHTKTDTSSTDEDIPLPANVASRTPALVTTRSQRTSKTEAMARITGKVLGMSTSEEESEVTSSESSSSDES
ncbi:Condensin complex subunit 3 [Nymphaea thermarum]|nr:Condensin complex subunit 3 [Nymphaea thermarum]